MAIPRPLCFMIMPYGRKSHRSKPAMVLVSCLANIDCDMRDQVICRRDHWDGATNQAIKG
jgi:hypothetical protein